MDLYIVLGLQRGATVVEIKRAYRRLARRYHPDINPGDREAAARFHDVVAAYETLTDPDRRRRYDTGQLEAPASASDPFGFAGFDFSSPVHGERATTFGDLFEDVFGRQSRGQQKSAEAGADLHAKVVLSFEQAWHGASAPVTVTRQITCTACAGKGARPIAPTTCVTCQGSGTIRAARGHMVFARSCPTCGGAGVVTQAPCDVCHGQGVTTRAGTTHVHLPAGIADGAHVRVAQGGHAGVRGGPPGDLLVDVEVQAHPVYQRDGDDVHMTVPVAIHEAALGARIDVPTPDGAIRLRVPPGTQSGQRFRLRERGALSARSERRGDLIVEARLVLPSVIDERSKDLLREFGRLNGENVRSGLI
jgi:molecular chaperone DnaJ